MAEYLTEEQVREILRAKIGYGYSRADMAREAGVHLSFVSVVLSGRKPPSGKLLDLAGVEKVTLYRRKEAPDD